jgi:hypothetical protein
MMYRLDPIPLIPNTIYWLLNPGTATILSKGAIHAARGKSRADAFALS